MAGEWVREVERLAWRGNIQHAMRALVQFFRANPQALILLIICVVLGLGTFIAVLISLAQHSNGSLSGEPSGLIALGGLIVR